MLSVRSSANFECQKGEVGSILHGKTEFVVCDPSRFFCISDADTGSKTTVFHDEKPVRSPDELLTVGTLLIFESQTY